MRYIAIDVYSNYDSVFVYSAVEMTTYAHNYKMYTPSKFIKETKSGIRIYQKTSDEEHDDEHQTAFVYFIPETHSFFSFFPIFYWYDQEDVGFPKKSMRKVNELIVERLTRVKDQKT